MNGAQKFNLVALSIIAFCSTVLISILFAALWDYRALVALCLLILGVLTVLVLLGLTAAHRLNEMSLRQRRYRHQEETPLNAGGYSALLQPGKRSSASELASCYEAQPHDERGHYD